jgi:hypothetical protein
MLRYLPPLPEGHERGGPSSPDVIRFITRACKPKLQDFRHFLTGQTSPGVDCHVQPARGSLRGRTALLPARVARDPGKG